MVGSFFVLVDVLVGCVGSGGGCGGDGSVTSVVIGGSVVVIGVEVEVEVVALLGSDVVSAVVDGECVEVNERVGGMKVGMVNDGVDDSGDEVDIVDL